MSNDQQYYDDEYSGGGPETEFEDGYPDDFDQDDDDYRGGEEDDYGDGLGSGNGYDEGQDGNEYVPDERSDHREADPHYLDDQYQDDQDAAAYQDETYDDEQGDDVQGESERYIYHDQFGYLRDPTQEADDGDDDPYGGQEQGIEGEVYDERLGYVQGQGQGDDDEQADDSRVYQEFETNDTMGVYNDNGQGLQYFPSNYQQEEADEEYYQQGDDHRSEDSDDVVGEGIKSYTAGYDEEYEYGGGDTINFDEDEDYSNTLYRSPRVRTQMRRDREASMRRSRQQRGRGPDAEERKHG